VFGLNLVDRFSGIDSFLNGSAQFYKISFLHRQQIFASEFAVSRSNLFRLQILHGSEHPNPAFRVAVPRVIERSIHASVPREQDSMFRQPSDRIARCMGMPQKDQLNALFAIIEDQFVAEVQRWHHVHQRAVLCLPCLVFLSRGKAVQAFRLKKGLASLVGHYRRSDFRILHTSIRMIPVIVSVKYEADRFIRVFSDDLDHFLRLTREVGINDEYEVLEYDPTLIAACKWLSLSFAEVNSGRKLRDRCLVGSTLSGLWKDKCQRRQNCKSQSMRNHGNPIVMIQGVVSVIKFQSLIVRSKLAEANFLESEENASP
jgi:hypothetical protein